MWNRDENTSPLNEQYETIEDLLKQWYKQSQSPSPVKVGGLDRKRLMQIFAEFGFSAGAEIGVDRGTFSNFMFKTIPNLHLYLVDPWHWRLRGKSRYESTVRRMEDKNATIIREQSHVVYANKTIPDESLDFIYIDGDHTFDFVMMDLIGGAKLVREGGIVAGHDYYYFRRAGVIPAVNTYCYQHFVHQYFITHERHPTWFFVKHKTVVDPLDIQD
jgi:hypothetical protein